MKLSNQYLKPSLGRNPSSPNCHQSNQASHESSKAEINSSTTVTQHANNRAINSIRTQQQQSTPSTIVRNRRRRSIQTHNRRQATTAVIIIKSRTCQNRHTYRRGRINHKSVQVATVTQHHNRIKGCAKGISSFPLDLGPYSVF